MSLSRTFRSYFAVSFALHAALPGCGAPPPPQAPVAPVAAAALAPPVVAPALDAVAAPPTLLVSGRVARPGASMSIVHGWTQLPVVRSEELTELMMGEAFGALVDVDQPMDFAVAITGSGLSMHALAALSVAIKDVDRAKALLTDRYKLTPGENGALLVQGLGAEAVHPDAEDAPSGRRVCELAPAYGAAPTRLVCGATTKALTELGPWLTRTLTRSPAVEDLHVDVRTQAIRATLAKDRRLISMLLTSALGEREGLTRDLASALAKDLVDFAADLDGLSLAVTLSEPAARAFLRFDLSGKTSSLARLMTLSTPKSPSGAGAFLELPGDADIAVFEPGINDDLWAQWRDVVLPAAASALAGFDVRDASRAAIADALGKLVPLGAISYASGVDTDAVRNAISAEKAAVDGRSPSSDPAAVRTATVEALFGWHVLAVDQPAAQLTAGWKDLAAALARSGSKDRAAPVARLLPMPRGAALPAGALHYEIEVRAAESSPSSAPGTPAGKASKPPKPATLHVLVVPDGAHSWVGIGGDEHVVAAKLALTIGRTGDKLAARVELADLKTPAVIGGFITLRGRVESALRGSMGSPGLSTDAEAAFGELGALPHHGAIPTVFFWGSNGDGAAAMASPAGDGSTPASLSVVVPRAAVEDAVTMILRHGAP